MLPIALRSEAQRPELDPLVIALHCSGGSGRQWRTLADTLASVATVVAPDLIGTASARPWCDSKPFSLADEAASVLALIDSCPRAVHLVGHSYGGSVALQAAVQRPARVRSLSLYEPVSFSLLRVMGPQGRCALRGIRAVAQAVEDGLLSRAYERSAERFVDYWNGPGTWANLAPQVKAELVRYLPKLCLEFRALFFDVALSDAHGHLEMPMLIMQGEYAPQPTALIAHQLRTAGKQSELVTVQGAGHMGPLTHAAEVAALICNHIRAAQSSTSVAQAA